MAEVDHLLGADQFERAIGEHLEHHRTVGRLEPGRPCELLTGGGEVVDGNGAIGQRLVGDLDAVTIFATAERGFFNMGHGR